MRQLAACEACNRGLLWAGLEGSPSLHRLGHRRRTASSPQQATTPGVSASEPLCLRLHHTALGMSLLISNTSDAFWFIYDDLHIFRREVIPKLPCRQSYWKDSLLQDMTPTSTSHRETQTTSHCHEAGNRLHKTSLQWSRLLIACFGMRCSTPATNLHSVAVHCTYTVTRMQWCCRDM